MRHRRHSSGFTLAEMMVAVAIFTALMAGLAILFTGTLRAVRQGHQQQEAFENARAALTALKNDLTISSGSEQDADYCSFYGTPIGMTFVGVARTSDDDAADLNIARITYVVYDMAAPQDGNCPPLEPVVFQSALERAEDDAGNAIDPPQIVDAHTYVLLRYVEPGVGDLDSFPIFRDAELNDYLEDVIDDVQDMAVAEGALDDTCDACVEGFCNAKRRELWILMLSGGGWERGWQQDWLVRSAWDPEVRALVDDAGNLKCPHDYVVMENVLSIADPEARYIDPTDPGHIAWRHGTNFFDYDYAENYYTNPERGEVKKGHNTWWNDYRSLNCAPTIARYCRDPRLPEVVLASFWMMYDSPYPGAPQFKRRFSMEIFLPVGYARKKG